MASKKLMVAASSGSGLIDRSEVSEASEEAVEVTYSVNEVLSRFGGLSGVSGDSVRFCGTPFGLSLRNAAQSGLMGVSLVISRVEGRVGLPTVSVASVGPSVMYAGSSMMRSGCASVMSMSGGSSLLVSMSAGAVVLVCKGGWLDDWVDD